MLCHVISTSKLFVILKNYGFKKKTRKKQAAGVLRNDVIFYLFCRDENGCPTPDGVSVGLF